MSKEIWPAGWLAQRVKEHHERIRTIEERLWPRSSAGFPPIPSMIKFAEAVRVSTLEEFVRRLKETL